MPTSNKIGVQILLSGKEDKGWLHQCVSSLESDAINVHFGKAIDGNLNLARSQAWDRMEEEYLSFVDPDDVVEPDAFRWCLDALNANPALDACYTLERTIDPQGKRLSVQQPFEHSVDILKSSPAHAHHLMVFRRRIYEKVKPIALTANFGLEWSISTSALVCGGLEQIPKIGYSWRLHNKGSHYSARGIRKDLLDMVLRGINTSHP